MSPRAVAQRGASWWGELATWHKTTIVAIGLVIAGASVGATFRDYQGLPSAVGALRSTVADSLSPLPGRVHLIEAEQAAQRARMDSVLTLMRWLACREEARDEKQPPREYCLRRMSDVLSTLGPQPTP